MYYIVRWYFKGKGRDYGERSFPFYNDAMDWIRQLSPNVECVDLLHVDHSDYFCLDEDYCSNKRTCQRCKYKKV